MMVWEGNLKYHYVFFLFLFSLNFCSAQTYTVSGYVYDAESGETLIGAYIFLNDSIPSTVTNNYGYYSIATKQHINYIKCHYIGYTDTLKTIQVTGNATCNFRLNKLQLQTVIIQGDNFLQDKINTVPLTVTELKGITQLGGEPDLMKALSMAPGIATAGEGLSKLIVRGGETDQNLIKLDGATVYNTSHLFGFVSIFNPDAIKSVTVYKGGFPAQYGGRLSSVLDFNMYDGNKKMREGSISIGTVTSHYFLNGPLKKDTASYMISARNSYLGLFVLPFKYAFLQEKTDKYSNYWMYDINGKINFPVTKRGRMFLSMYTGKDYFYQVSKVYDDLFVNKIGAWGNLTANARYTQIINSELFMSAGLSYNNYQSSYTLKSYTDPLLTKFTYSTEQTSSINDFDFNIDFTASVFPKNVLHFGLEVNPVSFRPIQFETSLDDSVNYFYLNGEIGNTNVFYNAVYLENTWQINNRVKFITGVRQVMFKNNNYVQYKTEPRITYSFSPENKYALSFSYAKMNQYVNLLTATQIGFQEEFYFPSDSLLSPSVSDILSAGFNRNLFGDTYYFSSEAFIKTMHGLITLKPGVTSVQNNLSQIQEIIAANGQGLVYGDELFLKKQTGRFIGWLEYTLSWNYRQFNEINNGEWFRSRYDRRNDIGITGAYTFNDRWSTQATWVYVTGQPLTVPDAIFQDPYGYYYFHIPSINNGKLPDYHRLDFSFTRSKKTKHQNSSAWSFGMYNAYGRINPVYADYNIKETKDALGNIIFVDAELRTTTLFRFLPFITYSLKFNNERKFY